MKSIKKNSFMAKKYKSLLIAGLLGWIVSLAGSLSDSILAGILISEDAVGAVALVTPLFNILLFFAVLLGLGVTTLFSIYMGAFEKEKAARINGMGLIIAIALGIVSSVLMIVLKDAFFSFYNSDESINLLADEYYSCFYILAFSYPIYWLVYYLVATDGDSEIILLCDIVTAVSNPVFSLLLVDNLGIRGLGYGSVLSNFLSVICLAIHFFKKNNSIRFKPSFSIKELGSICSIGSSISLGQIYLAIVGIAMNKLIIVKFGSEYLAAFAIINIILNFGGCFCCSIDAAAPFISVAYGEKNHLMQRKALRLASKYTLILGIVFNIAELLLARVMPTLYGISDPEVFASALYAGRVLAFMNIALAFEMELTSYYPRINQSLLGNCYTLIYSLVAPLALAVPLSSALGFKGLVWGFFLTPFITLLFGYILVRAKYGKEMYPFLIPESQDKIFVSEIEINDNDIVALTSATEENLKSCNVDPLIINQVQLMIEETFMIVKDKNPSKRVLADCSLIVSDEAVRLITRDNGIIFDITDVDAKITSLSQYTAARLIEQNSGAEYLTTISFNRNSFLWERQY